MTKHWWENYGDKVNILHAERNLNKTKYIWSEIVLTVFIGVERYKLICSLIHLFYICFVLFTVHYLFCTFFLFGVCFVLLLSCNICFVLVLFSIFFYFCCNLSVLHFCCLISVWYVCCTVMYLIRTFVELYLIRVFVACIRFVLLVYWICVVLYCTCSDTFVTLYQCTYFVLFGLYLFYIFYCTVYHLFCSEGLV